MRCSSASLRLGRRKYGPQVREPGRPHLLGRNLPPRHNTITLRARYRRERQRTHDLTALAAGLCKRGLAPSWRSAVNGGWRWGAAHLGHGAAAQHTLRLLRRGPPARRRSSHCAESAGEGEGAREGGKGADRQAGRQARRAGGSWWVVGANRRRLQLENC